MNYFVQAYGLDDLIQKLNEEEYGTDFRTLIAQAILARKLHVTDPLIDLAILDTKEEEEEFLKINKDYAVCYFDDGTEGIFNSVYFRAFQELVMYGRATQALNLVKAWQNLSVRKTDFLAWANLTGRSLPEFWFSLSERAQNPSKRIKDAIAKLPRMSDPKVQAETAQIMEEIAKRKDVPVLLRKWFKHDTWTVQQGLMLLAGFSPRTLFTVEENMYGKPMRRVMFYESLDGLEGDPTSIDAERCEYLLREYESLWNSGKHPDRASPRYFIDWASLKGMPPRWLHWARENGHFDEPPPVRNVTFEVNGKSETAYLNFIGALCDLYWRQTRPGVEKINQSELIRDLQAYEGFAGLSERNLKDKLPRAIKAISST